MKSSLIERLGTRVQVRAIDRVSNGSPATFSFPRTEATPNTPAAAVALARRHMPLSDAHRLMINLLKIDLGVALVAEVPMVEDVEALRSELATYGISAIGCFSSSS